MDSRENALGGSPNQPDATQETLGQPSIAPEILPNRPNPAPETPNTAPELADATFEAPTSVPATSAESGIFSSDDTRIETENLPEIVPEVVPQAPKSTISPTLRTESTVTGDLQLGGTTKKKKWPFIVLGVVAIGLAVWVWTLINNLNPPSPQERTTYSITDESRRLFNRYVNFLLEDANLTDKPDFLNFLANNYTYSSPGAMYAEKAKLSDNIENAQAYFNELNSMYNEFSQVFFPSNNDAEEYSRNALPDYFYEATKGSYLSFEQIANLYIQDGEESVRNLLETIFKSESENESIQALLAARKQRMELYLSAVVQASKSGCIINNALDATCAAPQLEAVENRTLELAATIVELETELRREAVLNLEKIYYAFYPDEVIVEGSTS